MRVSVVLPVFNEEKALAPLLERFVPLSPNALIVVNDGSSDRSAEVAASFRDRLAIEIVEHAVIRDGLAAAVARSGADDIIVTMDADNTHPPELIPEMVARIESGHDVVIASRYRKGARVVGLSSLRHVMSHGARFVFQLTAPI